MPIGVEDIETGSTGEHIVQFYERDSDLVRTVMDYLLVGLGAGEATVVIATAVHGRVFQGELEAAGVDVADARRRGTLQVFDAADMLSQLFSRGRVDGERFQSVIGAALCHATRAGPRVRVYGEMVALLWETSHIPAAIELEGLWNQLLRDVASTLFCAYPSHSVSRPEQSDALREVCRVHSSVLPADRCRQTGSAGPLEMSRQFAAEAGAPGAARQFVVTALTSEGYDRVLVDDAALVLTELAANALVHARSAFRVSLTSDGDAVRISVHDSSSLLPVPRDQELMAQSGRGLGLVAAIARRWGVDLMPEGKVVWAELQP